MESWYGCSVGNPPIVSKKTSPNIFRGKKWLEVNCPSQGKVIKFPLRYKTPFFLPKPSFPGSPFRGKGGGKNSRRTPLPKTDFGHPSSGTFSIPLRCRWSGFLYRTQDSAHQKPCWRGPQIFLGGALSGTFSSPHTVCTPPYHGPRCQKLPD